MYDDVPTELAGIDMFDDGEYHPEVRLSNSTHLVIGSFLAVSGFLGIVANCCIIVTILNKPKMSPACVVLLHLTFSDLGILIMGFPFNALSHLYGRWLFGWQACQVYGYCCFLFGTAHIGGLSMLAYEQYRTVSRMKPDTVPTQRYLDKLRRNYTVYGVLIWLFAFIWATPPLLGWSRYYYEPFGTACTIDWRDETFKFKSYILAYFVGGYVLPFSLMSYSFHRIVVLKKEYKKHSLRSSQPSIIEALKRQREEDLSLTCILTVLTFVITWTPYAVLCLWSVFLGPQTVPRLLAIGPNVCAKASGSLNPLVYALSNRKMRKTLMNKLCRVYRQRQPRLTVDIQRTQADDETTGITLNDIC